MKNRSPIEMYYDGRITIQDYIRLMEERLKKESWETDKTRKLAEEKVNKIKEKFAY